MRRTSVPPRRQILICKYVKESKRLSFFCLSVTAAAASAVVISAAASAVTGAGNDENEDDYPPAAIVSAHKNSSPFVKI